MQKLIKGEQDWHVKINNSFAEVEQDKTSILNTIGSEKLATNAQNIKGAVNEVATQLSQNMQEIEDLNSNKAEKIVAENIQQQVNNLVLGAVGDGNNSEVVQSRGFFKILNERLDCISNKIGLNFTIVDGVWTYPRGYNSTTGDQTTNTAMTATNYIKCKNGDMIVIADSANFKTTIYKYDSNKKFLGYKEITNNYTITHEGYVTISAYSIPITNPITEEVATNCKNNVRILNVDFYNVKNLVDFNISLTEDIDKEGNIFLNKPSVVDNAQSIKSGVFNYTKYPLYPVWGHEYLVHWYEKIFNLEQCKIVLDGDSITAGYSSNGAYNDAFVDMKGQAIKKIMKAGNYPSAKLTVFNNGRGGTSTNDWVGNATYMISSLKPSDYPNGKLDFAMKENPDLLIVGFGMNDSNIGGYDSSTGKANLSIQTRLALFEKNYREALDRIRKNTSVNGRSAYNKSVKDLSIILTTPTLTSIDKLTNHPLRNNENWHQYTVEIIKKLCREYKCAFVDFSTRTYGHTETDFINWSVYEADGNNYRFHPNKYSIMQSMSMLKDLIYPVCFWNIEV